MNIAWFQIYSQLDIMAEMSIVDGLIGLVIVGFLDLFADGIGKLFDNLCL